MLEVIIMALGLERKFGYVVSIYGIFLTILLVYKIIKEDRVVNDEYAWNPYSNKNNTTRMVLGRKRFVIHTETVQNLVEEKQDKLSTFEKDEANDGDIHDIKAEASYKVIPASIYTEIDKIVKEDDFRLTDCSKIAKLTNFVYVKVHKCASDTIAALGRRFAMMHNLSVVLPIKQRYGIGWPHQLQPYMYRPLKSRGFNIIVDHMVYNRTYLETIMPKDAIYFTSLRELMSRLISAVDYLGVAECSFIPGNLTSGKMRTDAFLEDMVKYDLIYKSAENVFHTDKCGCVTSGLSVVKNAMAFDLGFPTGFHIYEQDFTTNYTFILEWLVKIKNEMKVVVITHKFDESMVLLKKYMCWNTKDILYLKLNNWGHPPAEFPSDKIYAFQNWSNVDTLLFEMFTRIHSARVKKLGEDFLSETKTFQKHLFKVWQFCGPIYTVWKRYKKFQLEDILMPATKWDTSYKVTSHDCLKLFDKNHLRDKIKDQYDQISNFTEVYVPPNPGYKWC